MFPWSRSRVGEGAPRLHTSARAGARRIEQCAWPRTKRLGPRPGGGRINRMGSGGDTAGGAARVRMCHPERGRGGVGHLSRTAVRDASSTKSKPSCEAVSTKLEAAARPGQARRASGPYSTEPIPGSRRGHCCVASRRAQARGLLQARSRAWRVESPARRAVALRRAVAAKIQDFA